MFNSHFLENCNIILGAETVNDDANTDIVGDRINLANYEGVAVVILKPAGTAGDDLVLNFLQHTAASSGSSKALSAIRRLYFALGATTLAAGGKWVAVDVTETDIITTDVLVGGVIAASRDTNFVLGDALVDMLTDTNDAMIVFDIKSSQLDGGGGYNWFSMNSEGDAVGNALVANVLYIPYGAKQTGVAPLTITA